jgi:hypothetical protein
MTAAMVALIALSPARAGDDEDVGFWAGGQITTGAQVAPEGVGTILSQAEVDARWANDLLFVRLDLDYHFDPYWFAPKDAAVNDGYPLAPHYPLPPEFAMLQVGRDRYHLRLGVTEPGMGMQSWDERDNYLLSYSIGWALTNGQNAGVEPGIVFDDGTEIFAFGGYDLGFLTPGFGAGVDTEQEAWGTWTGFFALPQYKYALLISDTELYPLDQLWLCGEVLAGVSGKDPILGAQLTAAVFPESVVNGAIRVEHEFTPDAEEEAYGAPLPVTDVAAAIKTDAIPLVHLGVEGKATWPVEATQPYLTGTLLVSVGTADPDDDYGVTVSDE